MLYLKRVWKYVQNLYTYENQKTQKKILGTPDAVYKIANMWDDCHEEIHMAMIHILNEFTTTEQYNSENMNYYRKGLAELPKFFKACRKERDESIK